MRMGSLFPPIPVVFFFDTIAAPATPTTTNPGVCVFQGQQEDPRAEMSPGLCPVCGALPASLLLLFLLLGPTGEHWLSTVGWGDLGTEVFLLACCSGQIVLVWRGRERASCQHPQDIPTVLLWAEQSSWLVLLFRNVPGEGLSLHSSFFFLLFFLVLWLCEAGSEGAGSCGSSPGTAVSSLARPHRLHFFGPLLTLLEDALK